MWSGDLPVPPLPEGRLQLPLPSFSSISNSRNRVKGILQEIKVSVQPALAWRGNRVGESRSGRGCRHQASTYLTKLL